MSRVTELRRKSRTAIRAALSLAPSDHEGGRTCAALALALALAAELIERQLADDRTATGDAPGDRMSLAHVVILARRPAAGADVTSRSSSL